MNKRMLNPILRFVILETKVILFGRLNILVDLFVIASFH